MSEEGFRLPGSSYEDLANIIVAYGTRDEASNPGDVSKLDIVHQSSASRNNAFLISIGVLSGDREKFVTEQGRSLALALAHKDRAAIRHKWRELVSREEFMQNVLSAVKLREGIFPSTLQAYIAHYAGQPKNKPVMTGALAIIGILKAAGLLREEAGMLFANYDEEPEEPNGAQEYREIQETQEPQTVSVSSAAERVAEESNQPRLSDEHGFAAERSGGDGADSKEVSVSATTGKTDDGASVTVHVHVNCGPEDLEDLAPKIKRLVREIQDNSG